MDGYLVYGECSTTEAATWMDILYLMKSEQEEVLVSDENLTRRSSCIQWKVKKKKFLYLMKSYEEVVLVSDEKLTRSTS